MPTDSDTRTRRLKREYSSQITATRSVNADRFDAVSGNKLRYSLYAVSCPDCGERRIHNSDGPRRCPCGTHYTVVVSTPAGTAA